MRGALRGGPPALVVDLRAGDVAVAEDLLHLGDVDAGVEQERCGRRAERVRRVDAAAVLRGSGQLLQVRQDGEMHRGRVHRPLRERLAA